MCVFNAVRCAPIALGYKMQSDEGLNFWITIDEMRNTPSENQMPKNYLPMFLDGKYCEAFGSWDDDEL